MSCEQRIDLPRIWDIGYGPGAFPTATSTGIGNPFSASVVRIVRGTIGLLIVIALTTTDLSADPVHWSEFVFGDLPRQGVPVFELPPFGVGINIVDGSQSARAGGEFDFDSFAFRIPDGALLSSVEYGYDTFVFGGTSQIQALRSGSGAAMASGLH